MFLLLLHKYLAMELQGHVLDICNFKRNCQKVLQGVVPFYIPTCSECAFWLLCTLANLQSCRFHFGYCSGCEMLSHSGLN